jgi:hypothetical protein
LLQVRIASVLTIAQSSPYSQKMGLDDLLFDQSWGPSDLRRFLQSILGHTKCSLESQEEARIRIFCLKTSHINGAISFGGGVKSRFQILDVCDVCLDILSSTCALSSSTNCDVARNKVSAGSPSSTIFHYHYQLKYHNQVQSDFIPTSSTVWAFNKRIISSSKTACMLSQTSSKSSI